MKNLERKYDSVVGKIIVEKKLTPLGSWIEFKFCKDTSTPYPISKIPKKQREDAEILSTHPTFWKFNDALSAMGFSTLPLDSYIFPPSPVFFCIIYGNQKTFNLYEQKNLPVRGSLRYDPSSYFPVVAL